VKQIDLRVSIKFYDDGHTGFVFEPLTPKEFEKTGKQLMVWQHGMITSLRSAIIKWSERHEKVNKRSIKKYARIQKRFMKEIEKAKKQAEQKPVTQPAVQ
jgi:hypothetical protein